MPERFLKQLFASAWLGVALGLIVEVVMLAVSVGFGQTPSVTAFTANLVQKASLAALVCAGLAVGLSARRRRMELMGVLGFFAAPAAFLIAGALHRAAAHVLQIAPAVTVSPTQGQFAILRAIEFGLLGAVVGIISRRPWGTLRTHAAAGLAFGLVFCGVVLLIAVQGSRALPSAHSLTAMGVNEVLLPLGCSLIICAANAIGPRVGAKDAEAQATP